MIIFDYTIFKTSILIFVLVTDVLGLHAQVVRIFIKRSAITFFGQLVFIEKTIVFVRIIVMIVLFGQVLLFFQVSTKHVIIQLVLRLKPRSEEHTSELQSR